VAQPKPAAVAESSASGYGNAVGRTSILDQDQFYCSLFFAATRRTSDVSGVQVLDDAL